MQLKSNLAAAASLLLLLSLALFFSCSRAVRDEAYYQKLSQYVYAYTSGIVGKKEPIRIRLVNAAIQTDQIGQPVDKALLQISPSIEGVAVWEDDRTILLQPEKPLKYDTKYEVALQLGKIYPNVPASLSSFEFGFKTIALHFTVITDGVQTPNPLDLKNQQITGRVEVNDSVEPEEIEQLLRATQSGQELTISWNHLQAQREHYFTIGKIARGLNRSEVQLRWDGNHLGIDLSDKQILPIPALDEFEVLSVRVDNEESQCIQVNFSDPLSDQQDLNGLVRLEGNSENLTFKLDGNFLRIYPESRLSGLFNLQIEGIENLLGVKLKTAFSESINLESLQPGLRLLGHGAIIPSKESGAILFPFEAVGLQSVDVEIFKIFQSNILQHLQVNELEGNEELERVGKIIAQKKIELRQLNPGASTMSWQRYALDLQPLIQQDPGAIYQVRLSFRGSYVDHSKCEEAVDFASIDAKGPLKDEFGQPQSLWGGYRGVYWDDTDYWWESDGYQYENRDNPCQKEYYHSERFLQRNVFVSNLGLSAKRGKDGSLLAVVTDLLTAEPVAGVELELVNYQLQPISTHSTGADGTFFLEQLREKPFVLVAQKGNQRGYLRMSDGGSLSLSRFDVAGVESQKGLKGFLYGERGVWRPGDSIFLNFVLEDRSGKLPPDHPIHFEVTDPTGGIQFKTVVQNGVKGVFPLHFSTQPDAPTGNWLAKVEVGGARFEKILKIETVKPNRFKIQLGFPDKQLVENTKGTQARLNVEWLHGATAKNVKAKVDLQIRAATAEFPGFKNYVFEDPARSFFHEEETVFEGYLDDRGNGNVPLKIQANKQAPGKLVAQYKIKAFESSGEFSVDQAAIDFYPFARMVGVRVPMNQSGSPQMDQGKSGKIEIACVDTKGRPLANKTVHLGLYRCDWRWWWDEDQASNTGQFNSDTHLNAVNTTTVTTDANGIASWTIRPNQWGRYLVRAVEPSGGHAAGNFFWVGYPEHLDDLYSRNAVAMLALTSNQENYLVGQQVEIKVPSNDICNVLITLESGQRVLQHLWFKAQKGENTFKFKAEASMAPAVYAHVSLIQPHAQTINDLPIRMYGVIPITIHNPATELKPLIEMADQLKPDVPFTVRVKEASGMACAYTLAIVDEGLLDLTRFETPNPHKAFYAREALGVKSWDVYDYVLGAFGVELERILSIGGDDINRKAKRSAQVSRFKPTVKHLGPFYLEKGKTAQHTLKIENYVGSVRVMAVFSAPAPNAQGAYGSAEKTCAVKKPLMILPTLPRVLGPGESVRVPVQVFAMEPQIKSVKLQIKEIGGKTKVKGPDTQTLTFSEPGDQMAYFEFSVGPQTGPTRFRLEAQGGSEIAKDEIDLMVRNPMPISTKSSSETIEPGMEWKTNFDPSSYSDLNNATLELSSLPPMDIDRHLNYLIQYPHGCLEQTTSAAFPQLFAGALVPLQEKQTNTITKHITAAISKISNQQNYSGGFNYWPGGSADTWSTTYAGHFLLEAQKMGYAVPSSTLDKWIAFQVNTARNWTGSNRYEPVLDQAYRLYSLALAGKASMTDMNRLREQKGLFTTPAYLLAAAYANAGKPEVAQDLLQKNWTDPPSYDWSGSTYGSVLRDQAIMLEALTSLGDLNKAENLVKSLSEQLSKQANSYQWNTQSLAVAIRSLAKYAQKVNAQAPSYLCKLGGKNLTPRPSKAPFQVLPLHEYSANNLTVRNNGTTRLYARLVLTGQEFAGTVTSVPSSNLELSIRWETPKGEPVNISQLQQGTDFVAIVSIRRNGSFHFPYNELALTQIFPSGWEILNHRVGQFSQTSNGLDYQDFRDDRVLSYFDLGSQKNQTKTIRISLNAAYKGRFFLPSTVCEAMYDNRIHAGVPGSWVEVI